MMPARVRRNARISEAVAKIVLGSMALLVVGIALFVVGYIVYRGAGALGWDFLTGVPKNRGREGGIFPVIVGTFYLVSATAAIALPVGVL
ncbi:phosphate ABC transporter, permease protein PstA, partial [bacterium]|nr:phosphate ABC transporter, permease protein PstA [bacterium]